VDVVAVTWFRPGRGPYTAEIAALGDHGSTKTVASWWPRCHSLRALDPQRLPVRRLRDSPDRTVH
jgi:hypothetical protein